MDRSYLFVQPKEITDSCKRELEVKKTATDEPTIQNEITPTPIQGESDSDIYYLYDTERQQCIPTFGTKTVTK